MISMTAVHMIFIIFANLTSLTCRSNETTVAEEMLDPMSEKRDLDSYIDDVRSELAPPRNSGLHACVQCASRVALYYRDGVFFTHFMVIWSVQGVV